MCRTLALAWSLSDVREANESGSRSLVLPTLTVLARKRFNDGGLERERGRDRDVYRVKGDDGVVRGRERSLLREGKSDADEGGVYGSEDVSGTSSKSEVIDGGLNNPFRCRRDRGRGWGVEIEVDSPR